MLNYTGVEEQVPQILKNPPFGWVRCVDLVGSFLLSAMPKQRTRLNAPALGDIKIQKHDRSVSHKNL